MGTMTSTAAKATSHRVTPTPAGFVVVSGTSGASYLVAPLATGGAACNCAHGRHVSALASRCSHVLAVEAFAATVALPADPFEGFRDKAAKRCPDCSEERPGYVLVYVCNCLDSRNCGPEKCARWEVCAGCFGTGFVS
jgi:hypothetical protein